MSLLPTSGPGSIRNVPNATNTKVDKDKPNFWVRTGNNKPIAVDVYNVNGPGSLNSGTDGDGGGFSNTFDVALGGALGKVGGILGKLKTTLGFAAKAKAIFDGKGSIADKIKGLGGLSQSVLNGLNIKEGTDLYNKITAATNMVVTVADTTRKLQNVDWKNLDSVAKLVGEYTKDNNLFKIKDLGAEGAFIAGIVNDCVRNGIPNSFEKIVGVVSNSANIKAFLGDILPVTMSMSDLNNLKGIVNFLGGPEMKALFPGFVEDFTSGYKRQFWDKDETDGTRFKQFHQVMDAGDPQWWKTTRNGKSILSVEKIIIGTDEFKSMYRTGSMTELEKTDDKSLLIISTIYRRTTVSAELKRHFPRTLVKSNIVKVNRGNENLLRA